MTRNSHVIADFDGSQRHFEIAREAIDSLENVLPGGAYYTLKRFHSGTWTSQDVTHVLAFGLHELMPSERITLDMQARVAALTGRAVSGGITPSLAAVRRVLINDGHGNYSGLAERVLRAAVLGIDDDEVQYVPDAE